MAGNWYMGGIKKVEQNNKIWANEPLNASLVAGTGALSPNQRSWEIMSQFTGAGHSFIPGCENVTIPTGRTSTWNDTLKIQEYAWPSGIINMGTPSTGLDYKGILIHEGTTSDGSAIIWAFQRVTGTTQGGPMEWGGTGSENKVFSYNPITDANGNSTGEGFTNAIWYLGTDMWNDPFTNYTFGFALVRSGAFQQTWQTVLEATTGGMVFCTNAGYEESSTINLSPADRANAALDGASNQYYYGGGILGADLVWDGANLQTGEDAIGVLGYIANAGGPAGAQIFMYNAITPSITLTNGQNVRYGQFTNAHPTYSGVSEVLMATSIILN